MRLYEFTNAEEQLGLLRIIIDNTWTAIAQQAKQQKGAEAQRKAQAKSTPRKAKASRRIGGRATPPHQPSAKKQPTLPVQQPNPKPTPVQNTVAPIKPLPTPTTNVTQPLPSVNQATAPKDGYLVRNTSATEKGEYGDDGYSKNGIATQRKVMRALY